MNWRFWLPRTLAFHRKVVAEMEYALELMVGVRKLSRSL